LSSFIKPICLSDSDRVAEYDMKLMDIDTDALGIPDTEYEACVTMSAVEFGRICRDLSQLGESVRIEVSKEGVRFASDGEAANGNVLLKQTESARHRYAGWGVTKEDDAEGSKKKAKKAKKEAVKKEDGGDEEAEVDEDGDVEEDDGGTFKVATSDHEESDAGSDAEEEEGEEETTTKKKRKRASTSNGKKAAKKARKSADDGGDSGGVAIEMSQAVNLTFSLKYLVNFAKSGSLVDTVVLKMHSEVPLLVRAPVYCFVSIDTLKISRLLTISARVLFNTILLPKLATSDHIAFVWLVNLGSRPVCIHNSFIHHMECSYSCSLDRCMRRVTCASWGPRLPVSIEDKRT
jgi:Proliferating cell nuclear antigen, C-terminal domain